MVSVRPAWAMQQDPVSTKQTRKGKEKLLAQVQQELPCLSGPGGGLQASPGGGSCSSAHSTDTVTTGGLPSAVLDPDHRKINSCFCWTLCHSDSCNSPVCLPRTGTCG
jgi:hypothetical protein